MPFQAQRDRQSLTPVTVKQIHSALTDSGDVFRIDNAETFVVKIIGRVESVDQFSTNICYKVHDGTGIIECKHWLDKDQSNRSSHAE